MNIPSAIPSLSDSAMLIYVRVGVWSARKLDKKQTGKTIKDAGATNDAARVNKHLLANADAKLREVQRAGNAIREYVEANTLPWDDAGNRIISNDRALIVVGELENLRKAFDAAADAFIAEYPALREEAMRNLGDMADPQDYPSPAEARAKFSARFTFSPVAVSFGDERTGMSEAQVAAWQRHHESNVKQQLQTAFESAVAMMRDALEKYHARLELRGADNDKVGIFRDTMVDQLRHAVAMLKTMNIFNDPRLTQLANEVDADIACHSAATLRVPTMAVAVRQEVSDMLAKMTDLFGA